MSEEATQETTTEAPVEEAKTFTQDQVDELIKSRLDRQNKKYADYAELKAAAEELAELKAAQLTELERLQEAANTNEAKANELAKQLRDKTIGTALREAAAKHGAVDANAAVKLAEIEVELDEDGEIVTDVEAAMGEFLQAHPYLLGKQEGDELPVSTASIPEAPGASRASTPAPPSLLEVAAMDPRDLARNPDAFKAAIEAMNSRRK